MQDLPSTLTRVFDISTKEFSKQVVFEFKDGPAWKQITYRDLREKVCLVSRYLAKEGVRKYDKVALMLDTSPEWGIFYFGIIFTGAACVPFDPKMQDSEISNILNNAGCALSFTTKNNLKRLKALQGTSIPLLKKIISIEDLNVFSNKGSDESLALIDAGLKADDIASILYTSGTTDRPKGVMLTHGNFTANFRSVEDTGLIVRDDRMLSALPLYHSYAFMVTLIVPVFLGCRIVYPESMTSEDIFRSIKERDVTVFVAVPQILYLIHDKIWQEINKIPLLMRLVLYIMMNSLWFIRRVTGVNLSKTAFAGIHKRFGRSFRYFISGGARLDPKKASDFFKFGFTILEGYGLTETSPVASFNALRSFRIGSVGKQVPGVTIKIDKPDGSGVGEVLIKGPNVMKGYYKRKDETDKVLEDGWFRSGDLGYLKRGFLYLVGRLKEVIVLNSGKNIYPEELEAHYQRPPFVKEVCLLGANQIKQDTTSDGLYAVVVADIDDFRKWGETDLERVIQGKLENLSKGIPGYQRILGFVISRKDLPRTRLGKIKRYEVLNTYKGAFLGKAEVVKKEIVLEDKDRELVASSVGRRALKCISQEARIRRDIYPNESLELSLGVDSLTRVEIVSALEREFNVDIPASFAAEVFYVRDVIKGMDDLLKKKYGEVSVKAGKEFLKDEEFWPGALEEEPSPEIKEKIELNPGLLSKFFTFLMSTGFYLFFKVFHNIKVYGKEFIPRDERPLILCVNHTSYYDAFVVAFSLPFSVKMKLFFFGFKGYFQVPVMRKLVKTMRVISIDTAEEVLNGMQSASFVLRNNKMLCIFPEGQRSFDGKIKEFKKGVGILAKELDAEVLPVTIEGAFKAWPRTNAFPRPFHPIKVHFGKPLDHKTLIQEAPPGPYQDDYEKIAAGLRKKMME